MLFSYSDIVVNQATLRCGGYYSTYNITLFLGIQNPMDERDALPTPLSEQSSATPLSELSPATPLSELSPATPLSELSPATPLSELSPATTEDTHAFCNRSYRSHNDSRIVDFFVPDGCAGGGVRVSDGTSLEDQHLDQRLSSDVFADTEGQ